jgi:hypothetical protein
LREANGVRLGPKDAAGDISGLFQLPEVAEQAEDRPYEGYHRSDQQNGHKHDKSVHGLLDVSPGAGAPQARSETGEKKWRPKMPLFSNGMRWITVRFPPPGRCTHIRGATKHPWVRFCPAGPERNARVRRHAGRRPNGRRHGFERRRWACRKIPGPEHPY